MTQALAAGSFQSNGAMFNITQSGLGIRKYRYWAEESGEKRDCIWVTASRKAQGGNGMKHCPGEIGRISVSSNYVGEGIPGECTPRPGQGVARVMSTVQQEGWGRTLESHPKKRSNDDTPVRVFPSLQLHIPGRKGMRLKTHLVLTFSEWVQAEHFWPGGKAGILKRRTAKRQRLIFLVQEPREDFSTTENTVQKMRKMQLFTNEPQVLLPS